MREKHKHKFIHQVRDCFSVDGGGNGDELNGDHRDLCVEIIYLLDLLCDNNVSTHLTGDSPVSKKLND